MSRSNIAMCTAIPLRKGCVSGTGAAGSVPNGCLRRLPTAGSAGYRGSTSTRGSLLACPAPACNCGSCSTIFRRPLGVTEKVPTRVLCCQRNLITRMEDHRHRRGRGGAHGRGVPETVGCCERIRKRSWLVFSVLNSTKQEVAAANKTGLITHASPVPQRQWVRSLSTRKQHISIFRQHPFNIAVPAAGDPQQCPFATPSRPEPAPQYDVPARESLPPLPHIFCTTPRAHESATSCLSARFKLVPTNPNGTCHGATVRRAKRANGSAGEDRQDASKRRVDKARRGGVRQDERDPSAGRGREDSRRWR
jgi:hypothetical protein